MKNTIKLAIHCRYLSAVVGIRELGHCKFPT